MADLSEIRICCLGCGQQDPEHDVPVERLVYDAAAAKPGDVLYLLCRECLLDARVNGPNGGVH